ncbi:MAG: ferritin family protein [Christensenellaceae bacterium]
MQFEKTETFKNLARSFAGESQAGMRYQLTAKLAGQQNLKTLSDAIRTIAKNETYHAKRFFEIFQEKAGSHDNIVLDAGYPFHAGTLEDNLRFAAIDEKANPRRFIRHLPTRLKKKASGILPLTTVW